MTKKKQQAKLTFVVGVIVLLIFLNSVPSFVGREGIDTETCEIVKECTNCVETCDEYVACSIISFEGRDVACIKDLERDPLPGKAETADLLVEFNGTRGFDEI